MIAGINRIPIPRGINARITINPTTAPNTEKIIFNSNTLAFKAATMKIKNTNIPNNISILSSHQLSI